MSTPTRSRRLSAALLTPVLIVALAACGSDPGPSVAGPSGPSPSVDAGPVVDPDAVLADPTLDGRVVRVRGFFLATDGIAQLCSIVLESYPPQCGGGTIRLTGEVPAGVLAQLDSTSEPGLAQASWGEVEVVGTFRASGPSGQPTIELSSIAVTRDG